MKQLSKTLISLALAVCLAFVTAGFVTPINLMQANATSIRMYSDLDPQDAPDAPTMFGKTATSITLNEIVGAEYSIDGTNWQEETEFTGLDPNTGYTFFARFPETDTHEESPISAESEVFTTYKHTQDAPAAPTMFGRTSTSITLSEIIGAEFSIDGDTWQDETLFTGLSPNTGYTFFARLKETSTHYESPISVESETFTTDMGSQVAPSAPTLLSMTSTSITLNEIIGAEFSIDGDNWQDETVFTDLSPNTDYTFFARLKATSTHNASPASAESEIFTTNKADGTFAGIEPIDTTFTHTLTLADLTLPTGYAWVNGATSLNAGQNQVFAATFTDPSGDFHTANGSITVNVEKAEGVFAGVPPFNATYAPTLRLSDFSLPTGYTWVNGSTLLNAGNEAHDAIYTDPSGNFHPASGTITVNVAKATINMGGVVFAGKTITYDGNEHSLVVTNLPTGVSIESYTNNNKTAIGVYTVTVNFAVADEANFYVPVPMTATLTIIAAQEPVISAQSQTSTTAESKLGHTLSVTASSPDGGTLSYQWFSNTTASNTGGRAIEGATSSTFTASRSVVGTFHYYVVVTNTNSANGESTSVASDVITLTVNSLGIVRDGNRVMYIDKIPVIIIFVVVFLVICFLIIYVATAKKENK